MLNISALNSHTTGNCKVEDKIICTFNADIFNTMLNSITVSGMFTHNFVENVEAVKKDFGDFCDYLITLIEAQNMEEENSSATLPNDNNGVEPEIKEEETEEEGMKETPIL